MNPEAIYAGVDVSMGRMDVVVRPGATAEW